MLTIAERNDLVVSNLFVAKLVARRLKPAFLEIMGLEDATQAASICLMDAAQRFDPSRNVKFSTFAYKCVRRAIVRHCWKSYAIKLTEKEFSNMSKDSTLPRPVQTIEKCATDISHTRCEILDGLEKRDAWVLFSKYWQDKNHVEIGKEIGASNQAVRRRVVRAESRLKQLLGDVYTSAASQEKEEV